MENLMNNQKLLREYFILEAHNQEEGKALRFKGIFSVANKANQNGRIYPKPILENPILENLYTSNKDMSLSFILKKFNSMEKNIMEVQIDFTILKDNEICDIIFQSPLILSNKKMETIEEIIKNYGYVGLNITLFSIYGVDEIALQSSFFRRIKLIEQLEFVTFFKKGIAGTIPEDR